MSQVHILTLDEREIVALKNRRAEAKEKPPAGSPYALSKNQLKYVSYVPNTCFQEVVDRITGTRYKTRAWMSNWVIITRESLDGQVVAELQQYLDKCIVLDGADDVFGYVQCNFVQPYCSAPHKASPSFKVSDYAKFANVIVFKGKPVIIDYGNKWSFDKEHCQELLTVRVRNTNQLVTAIASESKLVTKKNK